MPSEVKYSTVNDVAPEPTGNTVTEETSAETTAGSESAATTQEITTSESTTAVKPDSNPNNNTLLIVIIIAAVVVIAVVVVIVVLSKKKSSAAPYQPTQTTPTPANGAVITGMKGMLANRSFNINGSIVLGRNPQKCNVCFPVDAKGISGVHCQIRQTGSGYEIMDCGSSNGTFLGNGQKLTPNVPVPIPDGTYFYLGSAEQLFQIKY